MVLATLGHCAGVLSWKFVDEIKKSKSSSGKAQTAAIAAAIARICNAADRPRPQMPAAQEIMQRFLGSGPDLMLLNHRGGCLAIMHLG